MLFLGIDVGTSGVRAVVIDQQNNTIAQVQQPLPESQPFYLYKSLYKSSYKSLYKSSDKQQLVGFSQQPQQWWSVLTLVIEQLGSTLKANTPFRLSDIKSLAIDGTSGTVLLADKYGAPCAEALMYNDQRAIEEASAIKRIAPQETAAIGSSSGLAKLLWLNKHCRSSKPPRYALNQSDWLTGRLLGKFGYSDPNNALKMGFDTRNDGWPQWLTDLFSQQQFPEGLLPEVHLPGEILGNISPELAAEFDFNPELAICAGTTDSTAAIIATGAQEYGEAVTSLGSTLVMKVIAEQPVFNQHYGVYSQPYGKKWLVGGSSSSGGAVLKSLFSADEISDYSEQLLNKIRQGQFQFLNLNYYPLLMPGERFPVHNAALEPVLSPRPSENIDFFQAILEGMADIEARAYKLLLELGAPYPKHVSSIGGGACNRAWQYIREQKLGIPVKLAKQQEAAAGSAILARSRFLQ